MKIIEKFLNLFRCKHIYGSVDENNLQHCLLCNKAHRVECNHKYEIIHEIKRENYGRITGLTIISRCERCGDVIKTVSSVHDVDFNFEK